MIVTDQLTINERQKAERSGVTSDAERLDPHLFDPYYEEAFCSVLDTTMGVCCTR
jgi:hypothetical protein